MTSHAVDQVVVLKPHGGLCEGAECDELERELVALAEHGRRVIVNLSEACTLTARALGVLARAQRVALLHGGRIALCGTTALQRWLLGVTHLSEALAVYVSEEAALMALMQQGTAA
jgi:anti-anti-sigma regulatory factor